MAKQTINEYIGIGILTSPTFDITKFTSSDLKVFIKSARNKLLQQKEYIEQLELKFKKIIKLYCNDSESKELEKWFIESRPVL